MSDTFVWRSIPVLQNGEVHRVTTDALLLGGWIRQLNFSPMTILDAGTGTGILAIIAHSVFPDAQILAVDIAPASVHLVRQNIVALNLQGHICVQEIDLLATPCNPQERYNLVLCNPPFYLEDVRPKDASKRRSRHLEVPVADWMKALTQYVAPEGHLCIIVQADTASRWIHAGNDRGYFVQHRVEVYSGQRNTTASRVLLCFGGMLVTLSKQELIVREQDATYTSEFLDWTGLQYTRP